MKQYLGFLTIIITITLLAACAGGYTVEYSQGGVYGNLQHGVSAAPQDNGPAGYIVVFKRDVADVEAKANALAAEHGAKPGWVYTSALKGFSVELPEQAIEGLRHNPNVDYIEPDGIAAICAKPPPPPPPPAQVLPWGVDRIDADLNSGAKGAGVTVAVIDTGIDIDHPDIAANYKGGKNFVNTRKSPDDDNGHGTHVAGIIAGLDNTQGIIGVAPKAGLVAVKVLNSTGSGTWSAILAGIDWVKANKDKYGGIKVANMSFGGYGAYESLHTAIQNLASAGIVITAAAGNDYTNAASFIPGSYDELLCVSALTQGDYFAYYSNYGSVVDVIAPGTNVYSTYKGGGYATMSGTSMASPHVAGAAALYISDHPAASVTDVFAAIIAGEDAPLGYWPATPGYSADPDGIAEDLVNAETL